MISVLTRVLLGTLAAAVNPSSAGDAPSFAGVPAKMYNLAAVLPWNSDSRPEETLLPYLVPGEMEATAERDPMATADAVLQALRTITGKEFEYEGRELRVDDSGRLLVKAPPALHDLTARYLEFL